MSQRGVCATAYENFLYITSISDVCASKCLSFAEPPPCCKHPIGPGTEGGLEPSLGREVGTVTSHIFCVFFLPEIYIQVTQEIRHLDAPNSICHMCVSYIPYFFLSVALVPTLSGLLPKHIPGLYFGQVDIELASFCASLIFWEWVLEIQFISVKFLSNLATSRNQIRLFWGGANLWISCFFCIKGRNKCCIIADF